MIGSMPIYEYACTSCGERTEAKQGFTDPPLDECPHCGGRLRKLYSPVGIVFKGSGFYSTDARAKSAGNASKDDAKPAKTEKKPAAEAKPAKKEEKSA
jgi:putative FmdB family regulatory protein